MWSQHQTPPPISASAPLVIVQNEGSGHADAAEVRSAVAAVLTRAGRAHRFVLAEHGAQVPQRAQQAAEQAQAEGGIVVAAGGDGTQNALAQAALGRCVMGVLPQGTFNYFARAHGIPAQTHAAAELLLTGRPRAVQVGRVNDRVFLVNASMGLYPQLLEDREAWKARLGRSRLVAFGAGAKSLLSLHRPMRLHLESARGQLDLGALTLFVGNNPLQCEQLGLDGVDAVGNGQLAGLLLKPVSPWRMLGLMLRGALGTLSESDDVMSATFAAVRVVPRRAGTTIKVAVDGEVLRLSAPLTFAIADQPLWVLAP